MCDRGYAYKVSLAELRSADHVTKLKILLRFHSNRSPKVWYYLILIPRISWFIKLWLERVSAAKGIGSQVHFFCGECLAALHFQLHFENTEVY